MDKSLADYLIPPYSNRRLTLCGPGEECVAYADSLAGYPYPPGTRIYVPKKPIWTGSAKNTFGPVALSKTSTFSEIPNHSFTGDTFVYKLNSSDSLLKQPTSPASEPSPPEPEQLRQIAAKIEGLRSTSTMYLDLRPLLLEMWTVIVQMQAQLDAQNRK